MLLSSVQIQYRKHFSRTLHFSSVLHLFRREPTEVKRARMLMKLIKNNDKKKHWHLQLGATGTLDENIYDKVHRPHKRAGVLNSLFMKNITDVLSTGDSCPGIMGYGVEITGVRVTADYQIVNVYWQMSNVEEKPNIDVEMLLLKSAPDIRGELIRRNVLGKVPRIYFIRDPTNKRAADFERCLEISGVSEIKDLPTVPAEDLIKNLYKFSLPVQDKDLQKDTIEEPEKPKVTVTGPAPMPEKPPDMKLDIMGLNYEQMWNKVLAAKTKRNAPEASSSVVPHVMEGEGEFRKHSIVYSIPASPLLDDTERETLMKKFCVDKKAQWRKLHKHDSEETSSCDVMPADLYSEVTEEEERGYEEDYFEEEYEDRDDCT